MKGLFCLILCLSLVLSGCGVLSAGVKEPVTFYYLQSQWQYGNPDGIIASEIREASGHRDSLPYLLALYLMGPVDEDLRSPLPADVRILSVEQSSTTIRLQLNEASDAMTDTEFSLACACLTLTCTELTGADSVTLCGTTRSITMTRDSLTLYDDVTTTPTEETQ